MDKQLRISVTSLSLSTSLGFLLTMALSSGSTKINDMPILAICAILAYAINYVVFIPSFIARTEHYFDLTGSLTTITLIVYALAASNERDARSFIVAAMVLIWAIRLGSFLFMRAKQTGGDSRFDSVKHRFIPFLSWWSLQGLWILMNLAGALVILTTQEPESFGALAVIGICLWVIGFTIEVVADQQKKAFRLNSINNGKFISTGLWAWSRHPNYFGEILLWIGISVIGLPVLSGWRWVALISPIFVIVLLTKISGIPTLERRAHKQWSGDPSYEEYLKNTPILIMKPPSTKLKQRKETRQ
ncbi:MAG: hypothetical protein CL431_04950 [Acidimicrobiaceae bacterium]|nr:hypothetical protein [Acidimicrobiaceae bacterium]